MMHDSTPHDEEQFFVSDELRKLQLIELSILLEVHRICEKYSICYTLQGGTLLGAVWRGGFIPWDDDIDISMPREEYERFLSICSTELPPQLSLCNSYTEKNHVYPFSKICLNDTVALEASLAHVPMHKGVWIDIFPYDNCPDNTLESFLYRLLRRTLFFLMMLSKNYIAKPTTLKEIICNYCAHALIHPLPDNVIVSLRERLYQYYNKKKTKKIVLGSFSGKVDVHDADIFDNILHISFEGYSLPIPEKYDKVLTENYRASYMTPPPESERKTHELLKIDLGRFEDFEEIQKALEPYHKYLDKSSKENKE